MTSVCRAFLALCLTVEVCLSGAVEVRSPNGLMSVWSEGKDFEGAPARPGYSIRYAQFGAKGDGKTDDIDAIAEAHAYANQHGFPVKADDSHAEQFPYVITHEVVLRKATTASGKPLRLSDNRFMFRDVKVTEINSE